MMNMNCRRGIAVVVVLCFAVTIALFMYALVGSNTNLAVQNKKTLGQLQAYYLAQSAIQHAILKLRLLPKETFDAFDAGSTAPYPDVESDAHPQVRFSKNPVPYWSLYSLGAGATDGPLDGSYQLKSIKLESSLGGMKMVQDGYEIEVQATVRGTGNMVFSDSIKEEIIVSRFTGGIGP